MFSKLSLFLVIPQNYTFRIRIHSYMNAVENKIKQMEIYVFILHGASLVAQSVECLHYRRPWFDAWVGKFPGGGRNGNTQAILAWRIPYTGEPGRLYSIEVYTVGHN